MIIKELNHLNMDQSFGGKSSALVYLLCSMGFMSASSTTFAADWVISPSLQLQHIYTDNALLISEDSQSDRITVLRPSLSAYKEGSRVTLDFNYAPEYRYYWEETHDNEVAHFLRTEGNIEIAENRLFLDGWFNADRSDITSTGRTSHQGLTGSADDTDFYIVGLSPYLTAKLGDFSVMEARFTGDKVSYSEDIDSDSTGKRGDIAFASGSMFTTQIWEVLFQQSVVDYEDLEENNETTFFRAELIQQLTNQWALAFSAGYEEYELAVTEDRDDSTWSVGAIFTPTPRTQISLGVGERSFGDVYYFDFNHRSSRSVWTASYEQDFISARDELGGRSLFQRLDVFGNLVRDPILDSTTSLIRSGASPTINEAYYESKLFSTDFTYQTVRSSLSIRGSYHERIYDLSDNNTEDIELAMLLSRRITRLTTGYFQISGLDHEESTLTYDQYSASFGITYQFGEQSQLALNLSRLERDADTDIDSYKENFASISVSTQL
ncbi:MAG: TIGR03016 family PEP-CTERM system-associated outer membrane protein [Candidatus Thiodiazotropha sp.]